MPLPRDQSLAFAEFPAYSRIKDDVSKFVSDLISANPNSPAEVWKKLEREEDLVAIDLALDLHIDGIPYLTKSDIFPDNFPNQKPFYTIFHDLPIIKLLTSSKSFGRQLVMEEIVKLVLVGHCLDGRESEYIFSLCTDSEALSSLEALLAEGCYATNLQTFLKYHKFDTGTMFCILKLSVELCSYRHFKELFDNFQDSSYIENGGLIRLALNRATSRDPDFDEQYEEENDIHYELSEIFAYLLRDGRANLGENDNDAIAIAATLPDDRYLRLLLKDSRVDPSARNNEALKNAVQPAEDMFPDFISLPRIVANRRRMVYILLSDDRVNPMVLPNEELKGFGLEPLLLQQTLTEKLILPEIDGAPLEDVIANEFYEKGRDFFFDSYAGSYRAVETSGEPLYCLYIRRSKGRDWFHGTLNSLARLVWIGIEDNMLPAAHSILMNPKDKNDLLAECAREGLLNEIKLLLKFPGVNLCKSSKIAFRRACDHRQREVVRFFLDGASPELLRKLLNVACQCGSREAVEYMLSMDELVEVDTKCLDSAAFRDHLEIVDLLLNTHKLPDTLQVGDLECRHLRFIQRVLQDKRFEFVDKEPILLNCLDLGYGFDRVELVRL